MTSKQRTGLAVALTTIGALSMALLSPATQAGADPVRPECPRELTCDWVPAAHQQTGDPDDKETFGNYDTADRPHTNKIKFIVLHDTEEDYDTTLRIFQNPLKQTSAHYVVRSADGHVTQMVRNKDVAWQAGNWYVNSHSIGIEQEGFATEGPKWFTPEMYRSTAALVRYLADKYDIPLDRQHIIGHDEVPGSSDHNQPLQHWDPGPNWDWSHFMDLLGAPIHPDAPPTSNVVAINPLFKQNQQVVSGCQNIQDLTPFPGPYHGAEWPNLNGPCPADYFKDMPKQPTNFVWLRTAPSDSAPLIADPYIHADGSAGTTRAEDWGDQAGTGQEFVVADRAPDGWIAIWFAGRKAWFHNASGPLSAAPVKALTVTPKPGKATVPVYVESFPETSAYPKAFTDW